MATYSKEQSTVVALWVLAMNKQRTGLQSAPEPIAAIVNKRGDTHTAESILLHKHSYDRLLLGREINKTITSLQRRVAKELHEAGIAKTLHDA
jgi:hypothetical protein